MVQVNKKLGVIKNGIENTIKNKYILKTYFCKFQCKYY